MESRFVLSLIVLPLLHTDIAGNSPASLRL